ncbi:CAMK family protein kinase [Trichomonas vaginalis G3]|uniref:CAMK family protein kinase n=1 Tax=Trichomonas vaginalis (strain ATCC PRA-98 / G3) TaxID=412133 RepID=A2FIV6_TRIV3|nr:protein serine/threonine kinase protein [Trichomonas vaginalis G3]EAX95171.1 CAMK family protein kinase [Trichomonas vaginalis G3]KAI5514507.1 protein serine/threonine kinase protein [Trichomonas vaginalis G3]|eukprot:XP_001308101.1 CAMK family protein kinase [Trichomonas vaginalis G3]
MNQEEIDYLESMGFTVQDTIAKGGFGTIHTVYSKLYKIVFAMKKIPETLFNEAEIECLKAIDNNKIIHLYHYFRFKENVYLLMEYCPNDLQNLINNGEVCTEEEIIRYTYGLIQAVKAVHDSKIAHCDIKPSNFLIDNYGRVKISDFGLSAFFSDESLCSIKRGTKLFMAPEILVKQPFDAFKSDIWALGITIYYIATGRLPYYGGNAQELLEKIQLGGYSLENVKNVYLKEIIYKCLRINPECRSNCDGLLSSPLFDSVRQIREGFSQMNKFIPRGNSLQVLCNVTRSNKFPKVSIIHPTIKASRSRHSVATLSRLATRIPEEDIK